MVPAGVEPANAFVSIYGVFVFFNRLSLRRISASTNSATGPKKCLPSLVRLRLDQGSLLPQSAPPICADLPLALEGYFTVLQKDGDATLGKASVPVIGLPAVGLEHARCPKRQPILNCSQHYVFPMVLHQNSQF